MRLLRIDGTEDLCHDYVWAVICYFEKLPKMKENDIVHVRAEVTPSVQNADVTTSLFGRQAEVRPAVAAGLPPGFRDERIAGGSDLPIQFQLNTPTTLAFLPDGRLLVTEKGGKLRLVKNNLVQPTAVLDLTAQVSPVGDGGLISVAVDPDFATHSFIYLIYTLWFAHFTGQLARLK